MKINYLVYGLLVLAFKLSSCTSSIDESKQTQAIEKSQSADTLKASLVGVLEKNPPIQNGKFSKNYPSGIVQMSGFYLNGKRDGQWMSFFPDGKLQSEGFFKSGYRDGKAQVYYQTGILKYSGFYKDGREIGRWEFFDEKGVKINEKNYGSK